MPAVDSSGPGVISPTEATSASCSVSRWTIRSRSQTSNRKARWVDLSLSPTPSARTKSGLFFQEISNSSVARAGSLKSPRIEAPSWSVHGCPCSSRQTSWPRARASPPARWARGRSGRALDCQRYIRLISDSLDVESPDPRHVDLGLVRRPGQARSRTGRRRRRARSSNLPSAGAARAGRENGPRLTR